jgi:hypothetical protein
MTNIIIFKKCLVKVKINLNLTKLNFALKEVFFWLILTRANLKLANRLLLKLLC